MLEKNSHNRQQMLEKLGLSAVGIDVQYRLATGKTSRRIYLDSTASTLQLGVVNDVMQKYLPYYANTHTDVHFSAKLSNREYAWAHKMALDFVDADPACYGSFFVGSGATGCINRIARTLSRTRPQRDVVITTIMEHHSNDLPHRKHFNKVVHVPVLASEQGLGAVDPDKIAAALKKYGERVNYVALTGVSNVTGIVNPIYDIAELAHTHGTLILIDAAQMAAHMPIKMSGHHNPLRNLDMVVMSGHKIYAPASPGVVVTRLELFSGGEPEEVGGGMVDDVRLDRYMPTDSLPEREEAGTPNIAGAIALATALYTLKSIGMDFIDQQETALINYALERLNNIDNVVVYGQTDSRYCRRTGAISINIRGLHHALTAATLNDYFNIAVRNACFCAHPYVREMITEDLAEQMEDLNADLSNQQLEALAELQRGMVRASFGIYNTHADVDLLVDALTQISANQAFYQQQYHQLDEQNFSHNSFTFDHAPIFNARSAVDSWLGAK